MKAYIYKKDEKDVISLLNEMDNVTEIHERSIIINDGAISKYYCDKENGEFFSQEKDLHLPKTDEISDAEIIEEVQNKE